MELSDAGLVLAGDGVNLTVMDLAEDKLITSMQTDGVSCLKAARYLCCAQLNGEVKLRDTRSLQAAHTLAAHAGVVTAMDVRGDLMVTVGMSSFRGQLKTETAVKVFDLRRTPRPLASMPTHLAPSLLKYNPKFSSTLVTASTDGVFQHCDVGGLFAIAGLAQVSANGLSALDVSPSGELMCFGDHDGTVLLWAENPGSRVCPYFDSDNALHVPPSYPPDLDPAAGLRGWGEHTLLSTAFFPPPDPDTIPLSDWPPIALGPTRAPTSIDPLFQVTQKDFVGYSENPGIKWGQQQLGLPSLSRQRRKLEGGNAPRTPNKSEASGWEGVPREYRKQEIKLGKLGIEDFNFRRFNKTPLAGLENSIPNSYTNAWIQTMFCILPLRTRVLNSLSAKEVCLTDELGFLFHMLLNSKGNCCQATNFLRAFSQLPEASRLELLDQQTATAFIARQGSDKQLLKRVHNLNRFVLEQMNKEMLLSAKEGAASAIDTIFGATMRRTATPIDKHPPPTAEAPKGDAKGVEGAEGAGAPAAAVPGATTSESREFQWRLSYAVAEERPAVSFHEVLETSLHTSQTTRAWNEATRAYRPTKVRRAMVSLPHLLSIDCGIESPFGPGAQLFRSRTKKPAAGCGEEPGGGAAAEAAEGAKEEAKEGGAEVPAGEQAGEADPAPPAAEEFTDWLPMAFRLEYDEGRGSVRVSEVAEGESAGEGAGAVYRLTAVMSSVFGGGFGPGDEAREQEWQDGSAEDGRHLVTHVRFNDRLQESFRFPEGTPKYNWLLYNDFLIQPCPASDVTHFPAWRTPAVLYYSRHDLEVAVPPTAVVNPITRNVFKNDRSLGSPALANKTPTFVPPSMEELSTPMLVGIDAEFVALTPEESELRLDGTNVITKTSRMSLGRVSVVRSLDSTATVGVKGAEQRLAGTPMIDDYIKTPEQVMDYLTRFSGLVPGDLDPATSPHHLIPLKRSYTKLRYLVDRGYTFVGHGLNNDFRIINVYVPPEQIIDTVNIYHLPNRRKIALRFLSFLLLGQNIQADIHDSVEDARTALLLYQHYQQLSAEGRFEEELERIYDEGVKRGWQVPDP